MRQCQLNQSPGKACMSNTVLGHGPARGQWGEKGTGGRIKLTVLCALTLYITEPLSPVLLFPGQRKAIRRQ